MNKFLPDVLKQTSTVYSVCFFDNFSGHVAFRDFNQLHSQYVTQFSGFSYSNKRNSEQGLYIKTELGKSNFTVVNTQKRIYFWYYLLINHCAIYHLNTYKPSSVPPCRCSYQSSG